MHWISIKEKTLPNRTKRIILLFADNKIYCTNLVPQFDVLIRCMKEDGIGYYYIDPKNITHWMEIDQIPLSPKN